MSMESVMEFWQKVQDDKTLQKKVSSAVKSDEADTTLTEVMAVASAAGFSFTADHYKDALLEVPKLLASGSEEVVGHGRRSPAGRLVGGGGALAPGGVLRRGGCLRIGGFANAYGSWFRNLASRQTK